MVNSVNDCMSAEIRDVFMVKVLISASKMSGNPSVSHDSLQVVRAGLHDQRKLSWPLVQSQEQSSANSLSASLAAQEGAPARVLAHT
jgi:hypothetical protein